MRAIDCADVLARTLAAEAGLTGRIDRRILDIAAHPNEVVPADVLDPASLPKAMAGGAIAYYLVHSMGLAAGFEEQDRAAARNFGAAARAAGVRRIVYLGGLGEAGVATSPHLRSRQEVGDLLRASGVEVIEFRASVVLGSGSLSFELIRALVERLPMMIAPRWVAVKTQPIGIADLLAYLVAALDLPPAGSRVYEIGGADQVSFGDLMREYARHRGLRRLIVPVPVLTPRLSSLWLGLVTPVYARVGRKLIDSMTVPTVVRDASARRVFSIAPRGVGERPPVLKPREVITLLERHGFAEVRQRGSHKRFRHPDGRDIAPTLLRQIARDVGLTLEEFLRPG